LKWGVDLSILLPVDMRQQEFLDIFRKYGQEHILSHYETLPPARRAAFLEGLEGLDFDLVFGLYKDYCTRTSGATYSQNVMPAPIIPLPGTPQEEVRRLEAQQWGEDLIRGSKVAVLIVAGGQGSRLGHDGPKGTFSISPVQGKSLFQLFAESVMALSLRFEAAIPLVIMTSEENNSAIRTFFQTNQCFGLPQDGVHFFRQGGLPSITPEGSLILKDETHLFVNPDGHGGSLKGLYESGILARLMDQGFSELFYCQVDNPLARIADPVFLGYHRMAEAESSTKVVRRASVEEKVGVYLLIDGREAIIEYSDLGGEHTAALDNEGNILYWAGNTAIHIFSLPFIKRLNDHGFALPYHCATRTVQAFQPSGNLADITAYKYESFVFDAIPLARRASCIEVARQEEFSPVKNREGVDSPETARMAMTALHRSWLQAAGAEVSPGAQVEISPLFALDREEFVKKVAGRPLSVTEDTYFG
jgi:UDP-N-acetylglucosamine/UDP-N-acetylgalactosamine diphosphorylase